MKHLIFAGLALATIVSCAQKKNKAEPAPGQQVGLWLTQEEKPRYEAAQIGSDETCGMFFVQLKNGAKVVRQSFALKILDNGQSEICNHPREGSDELHCYGIKERVELRTGKAEIFRDGGACDAHATANDDTLTVTSQCGTESKSESSSYFRVTQEGFLKYLAWADKCREEVTPKQTQPVPDEPMKVQPQE
jgi:hypothetical protein